MTAPYTARRRFSIALLLAGLLGAVSQAVAVELPAVEAVTYDGAKVVPHEFVGDVRSLPAAIPSQAPAMRPYRPLLRPPVAMLTLSAPVLDVVAGVDEVLLCESEE